MSLYQQYIIGVFSAITAVLVFSGFVWLGLIATSAKGSLSLNELKRLANESKHWYLNPFADRTVQIWKYSSWVAGAAWLIAGVIARNTR